MSKHEILSHIYNELWIYYKQFIENKDVQAYENSCILLLKEIKKHDDKTLYSFAENQIINFTPVINELNQI